MQSSLDPEQQVRCLEQEIQSMKHNHQKETEKNLRAFMDIAAQAIFILDPQLNIIKFNFLAAKIVLQLKSANNAQEIMGKNINVLFSQQLSLTEEEITQIIKAGLPFKKSIVVNGNHFSLTIFKVSDNIGMLIKKDTDSSTQTATDIAHDMNNILTSIGGYVELVEITLRLFPTIAKQTADNIKRIACNVTKGKKLMAKLMATKATNLCAIDLHQVISQACALFNANITTNFKPLKAIIRGNETWLGQIFANLISNALDAQGANSIIIATSQVTLTENTPQQNHILPKGTYIVVNISDSGSGIKPDELDKIFDRGFTTKPHGQGIGLALVRQLVTEHHGYITVTSKPQEGTKFTLFFPAL